MRITPLAPRRPRPTALLFPSRRRLVILTADGMKEATAARGVTLALSKLKGHTCYVTGGLTTLKDTTGATQWTCHTWRGRGTAMVHEPSGTTVSSLRGTLESAGGPEAAWVALAVVLEWLHGYGVSPGSISAMAWNLWRASLVDPVSIGFDPNVGRAALFGGRQGITEPRVYAHMVSADIQAAYPHAMASQPYGLSLRAVRPTVALDASVSGLADATVWVDHDAPFAPLPVRLAEEVIQFQTGIVKGTWAWCELAAAKDLGFRVDVHAAWAPRATADLFGRWWEIAAAGRALPGAASVLAKAICNSLWGQFAMNGEGKGATRWADDAGKDSYASTEEARNLPHRWMAHIAAETTARVRRRMLVEGLYGTTGGTPVHIDTDGIVMRQSNALPNPAGNGPGHWRIKAAMRRIDVRAPQMYRYTCTDKCGLTHPEWHYVASGVTPGAAAEVFRLDGRPTKISYRSQYDTVLPTGHATDAAGINRWLCEAGVTRVGS